MKPAAEELSVSVVMCTYNGASFVTEQLQSILQQTYPLKEILIFDDASTDETVSILKKFAEDYSNIKLHVNESNIGYTQNFQQAVVAATSDTIAVSDQDDIWVATKIERLIQAWEPDSPLIYCYSLLFENTIPENPQQHPRFRRFEGTDGRKLFMHNTVSGHAMLFRKSFLPLVLPFSEKVTYDWWMAVVACYNGGVQYLPEILVFQRRHYHNASFHSSKAHTKSELKSIFKKKVITNCTLFATAPNMPSKDRQLALELAKRMQESFNHSFYKPLFLLVLKYRKLFFDHKRRKYPFFTQVKHSFKITKN